MAPNSNQDKQKSFSMAKAILAVLWQAPEIGKERLFSHRYMKTLCDNKHANTFRSCIHRLQRGGLLKKDYNSIIALTEEGERQALFAFIEAESALHLRGRQERAVSLSERRERGRKGASEVEAPSEEWDGGWRIVFFDIPEKDRKYRDYLRKVLKLVGFKEFQRSIWAYPYPVPGFLKDLISEGNIKPHIKFITTNSISDDSDLKRKFNLF